MTRLGIIGLAVITSTVLWSPVTAQQVQPPEPCPTNVAPPDWVPRAAGKRLGTYLKAVVSIGHRKRAARPNGSAWTAWAGVTNQDQIRKILEALNPGQVLTRVVPKCLPTIYQLVFRDAHGGLLGGVSLGGRADADPVAGSFTPPDEPGVQVGMRAPKRIVPLLEALLESGAPKKPQVGKK
jgi:hypothetical protein